MKHRWTSSQVQAWYFRHSAITYANQEDTNVVVHKPNGLGWTVNWANPLAYLLQTIILAAVFGLLAIIQR